MNFKIKRIADRPDATFGVFFIDDIPRYVTLELPWKDNKHEISRIPTGFYSVTPLAKNDKNAILKIEDVPYRTGILIHPGNRASETLGCILLGEFFSAETAYSRIAQSKLACEKLHEEMKGKEIEGLLIE